MVANVPAGALLVRLGWPLAGSAQKPPGFEKREPLATERQRVELSPGSVVEVELRANLR